MSLCVYVFLFNFSHELFGNGNVILASYFLLVQKLKTRVIKKNCNPEWNDVLTLSVVDPNLPIKLVSKCKFPSYILG